MTTEAAQRRLLEALASLYRDATAHVGEAEDPLVALASGFEVARRMAEQTHQPATEAALAALIDLLAAVRADLNEGTHHG